MPVAARARDVQPARHSTDLCPPAGVATPLRAPVPFWVGIRVHQSGLGRQLMYRSIGCSAAPLSGAAWDAGP
jgi:hypothetical protein